jgi:hypothetical protein
MKHGKIFAKAALLGAVAVACMAASGGCGSDLHKASDAAGSIAAGLKTAADLNHNNVNETPQERAAVAGYIVAAGAANDNFIGAITRAEAAGGKVLPADVVSEFQTLVNSVNTLNSQGILQIKSQDAKDAFAVVIGGIQVSLATIQGLAGTGTSSLVKGAGGVMAAGVAFTPAEITELIELATAAASTLVPKLLALRGESDGEILTNASADDAAAEAEAEGDLAAGSGSDTPVPEVPVVDPPRGDVETEDDETTKT